MSISLLAKPQDTTASIDHELDFTDELADEAPLTLTALSWAIAPITGDPSPAVILTQANAPDFSSSTVRVTGGTGGYVYLLRCSRVWSDGERDVVSIQLPVGIT